MNLKLYAEGAHLILYAQPSRVSKRAVFFPYQEIKQGKRTNKKTFDRRQQRYLKRMRRWLKKATISPTKDRFLCLTQFVTDFEKFFEDVAGAMAVFGRVEFERGWTYTA